MDCDIGGREFPANTLNTLFSILHITDSNLGHVKKETSYLPWRVFKVIFICNVCPVYLSTLFVCLVGFLTSSSTTRLYRGRAPRQERLTILRAATHETELRDHDFCLSRSHYTDTDPTRRERTATAGIEPGTSSPGVARSTDWATAPPISEHRQKVLLRWLQKLLPQNSFCCVLSCDKMPNF